MMSIIRQFNSKFAVSNLESTSYIYRSITIVICGVLIFPAVSSAPLSYTEEIYQLSSWAFPVMICVLLKQFFLNNFAARLVQSEFGVLFSLLSDIAVYFLVDGGLLKNTEPESLLRNFVLFLVFRMAIMYIEATRRTQLAPSVTEARLTALTARIRPHFLFNSLNAAISLIRLRPYDAETLLENLANLFRAQLRDGSQSSTLGQEIEWAQEYIAIEQIRMGHTRVQVMWQHQAPDDAETPHLLLQPLLENAVFHGVESTHRPGMISVLTKQHKSSIFISIENPYIPPENGTQKLHKSNSMAMKNLKERLALIYDNDAKIQMRESDGTFRVDIRIPYRKKGSEAARLFG